jgi:hypothetical protein
VILWNILLTALISTHVYAAGIDVKVNPDTPFVINSSITIGDGNDNTRIVYGPWFKTAYTFTNNSDETVTITGIYFISRSVEGKVSESLEKFQMPFEVGPGQSVTPLETLYTGSLSPSDKTEYSVRGVLQGWTGPYANPSGPLRASVDFETQ